MLYKFEAAGLTSGGRGLTGSGAAVGRICFTRVALLVGTAGAALWSVPASAQAADDAAAGESDIVVTGSRIARPDYKSNSPILSVSEEAIQNTGQVTIERSLTQLPQFSGAFGQSNASSTATGLSGGQSYASLRGLGAKRTLLLLDGRRLQPSNPDGSVDLNIIPEELVERVEVITGGASTTYGSDATAGVVNFRLKQNFEGLTLNSQLGISGIGDAGSFKAAATMGANFDDDRGNAVLSIDYTKRNFAFQSDRSFYPARGTTPTIPTTPQGNFIFGTNLPTAAAVNAVFAGYGVPALPGNGSGRYIGSLGTIVDGTLYSTLGVPVYNFRDPETDDAYIVNAGGGAQQLNFGFRGYPVQSELERFNVFGRVNYELTESLNAFIQASFTDMVTDSISNPVLASAAIYGVPMPVTNPFIPDDLVPILASRPDPTATFRMDKALNFLGLRRQRYEYSVFQLTAGLSGPLGISDWTWSAYANHSRAKFLNEQTGGASFSALQRLQMSPTGGTEYCAGGYNPFGNITPSNECIAYISRRTVNRNELTQTGAEASLQGRIVELPAGEMRFAAGLDYRKNSYSFRADAALTGATSDIVGYSPLKDADGSVETREFFAELLVPVVRDIFAVQELNFDLGYRYSDYNSIGGVHTYKVDIDWTVTDGFRIRGGYNRAIRAPSAGELFAPASNSSVLLGTATATGVQGDPCDIRSFYRVGPSGADVRELCLAQGVPASLIDSYTFGGTQAYALSGGNPNLKEEVADTVSVGAVFQSPFSSPLLKRMNLSVDWYQIKMRDAIGPLSLIDTFQFCFNSGGANPGYEQSNEYCQLIRRDPADGQPREPLQPLANLGRFNVSGIDVQFDWRIELADAGLGNIGRLDLNAAVSYLDKFEIQTLPGAAVYNYAGSIGTGVEANAGTAHPRWKTATSLKYSVGDVSLGMTWRYIDKMVSSARVVTPTSTTLGVKSYHIFDLNGRFTVGDRMELRFGVNNLFDKKPPQVGNIEGTFDAQTYDTIGRYFFIGVKNSF